MALAASATQETRSSSSGGRVEMVSKGFLTPNRMPLWLARLLRRLERPSRLAAYIVAIARRVD